MIGEDTYKISSLQATIQGNCAAIQVGFNLDAFKPKH